MAMQVPLMIVEEQCERHPVAAFWQRARAEAIRRDRLPVAALRCPDIGRLFVVHEADLDLLGAVTDDPNCEATKH